MAGQRWLALNVNDPAPWLDLAFLFLFEGREGDPANAFERYAELSGLDAGPFAEFVDAATVFAGTGTAVSAKTDVIDVFSDQPINAAVMYQLVGRSDDALTSLERAHADRLPELADLLMRPELAPLYDLARFRAIAADIGLTVPRRP